MNVMSARRIVRWAGVREFTSLGVTKIRELMAAGDFPKPFSLSDTGRSLGWYEDEIAAWQAARSANRITQSPPAPRRPKARARKTSRNQKAK